MGREGASGGPKPPSQSLAMRVYNGIARVSMAPAAFGADGAGEEAAGRGVDRGAGATSPPLCPGGGRSDGQLLPILQGVKSLENGLIMAVRGAQKLRKFRNNAAVIVVGIGGPSGSGKSRLARKMAEILNCEVLGMEHYYVPSRIHNDNFDEVETMNLDLLCSHLECIKDSQSVSIPQFDVLQKKETGQRSFACGSGYVIVEGIYALHKKLRPFLDLKVCLTSPGAAKRIGRLGRLIGSLSM